MSILDHTLMCLRCTNPARYPFRLGALSLNVVTVRGRGASTLETRDIHVGLASTTDGDRQWHICTT